MLKIQEFKSLTNDEAKVLYQAPAMITALIASADGVIEEDETTWAKKVIHYRQEAGNELLFNYYEIAETYFDETLSNILAHEKGTQMGIAQIETVLEGTNPILAKLDADFVTHLVKSWRSLAERVAKASGGVLGFGTISSQEKKLMDLHIINF